ncbi:MAG: CDP-diacylglycerol--serine O-phosphatidyltransferase [Candidatus Zixiibacteriota bacterium]
MNNYKVIFPNTFTMANAVFGFLAILEAIEGRVTSACWFILLAALMDGLDGKIARLSGGSSQFGIELDSLADFLSFGVAPAVILYSIKLNDLGKWGWIISVIFIMAAAYRLARYNVLADSDEKKDFMGLPVPMAAMTLVSYIIFSYKIFGGLEYSEVLVSMIVLFAILMVSQVQYDAMPDHFNTRQGRIKLGLMLLAGVFLAINVRLLLFPILGSYILFGMIREVYRLFATGLGKVSGQPGHRRKTDIDRIDDGE